MVMDDVKVLWQKTLFCETVVRALAFGNNQGDVVMLLLGAESLDVSNDRGDN
jgi:hypothetical protein